MNIETIMIVDDSGMARLIMKQCLEIAGFRDKKFVEAINGKDALDKLNKEKIDLVLTDLNMPVMEGNALLDNIKISPELKNIPVIIITSNSNCAREAELKEKGAFAVINKPISPALIHKTCSALQGGPK